MIKKHHQRYIMATIIMILMVLVVGLELFFVKDIKSENEARAVVIDPMLDAAASGRYEVIQKLLYNGVSPNVTDNVGGDSYSLIQRSPENLNNRGNSAFAFAVWNGTYPANQKCIDLMLEHQADVRLKNSWGQPPFFWVVKIDYKDLRMNILGKLIKFGADINDKDKKGFTLLEKIVETYDTIGVEMVIDWWGKLMLPETLAAAKKRAEGYNLADVLVVLNKKKVKNFVMNEFWDPFLLDERTGMSDFHYAIINNDTQLVDTCLRKNAKMINQKSKDEFEMNGLHYAVLHYHPLMVQHLLKNGAQVNQENRMLNKPLHMVAWLSDAAVAYEIADRLLQAGALINARNKEGNTLLHLLVYAHKKDLIDRLAQKYAFDVNVKNGNKETVVDLASRLGRKELIKNINKNVSK